MNSWGASRFSKCLPALLAVAVLGALVTSARADTEIEFWNSYTNRLTGVQTSFNLTNYKRGHFVGPCGPTTLSAQWSYRFRLAGDGPLFKKGEMELEEFGGQHVTVDSGTILVDNKKGTVQIAIKISTPSSGAEDFIGNGTYKIRHGLLPDDGS
jgi:hypothetical protein